MQLAFVEFGRLNFDFDYFVGKRFVVETVSENIAKMTQSSLEGIGDCFFLAL